MEQFKRDCPNCNNVIEYKYLSLFKQANKRNSVCRSCRTIIANKSILRKNKLEDNINWKGYKHIPFNWFSKYFLRGKKKRTGDITIEQVYDLWIKQNQKCALSQIPINWNDDGKKHTCSIDRINSLKEYVIENIQLVHKDVNLMKNKFNNEYFIQMCKLIAGGAYEVN